jgi:tetraprenyl-beta-curcumene synthase
MSAVTHLGNGRVARDRLVGGSSSRRRWPSAIERLALGSSFGLTVSRCLLVILPSVNRHLAHWRSRAEAIPDTGLRRSAQEALTKRGNVEGAALFATLAPPASRRGALRALVAFQTAYNYLDALSELPNDDPVANATRLHQALINALTPGASHPDYYAFGARDDEGCVQQDGGYLNAILDACQTAVSELPSYGAVASSAREAAARILTFQALNLPESNGGHDALRRWASKLDGADSDLAWWETAAGAGSSLPVYALIAAAADPQTDPADVREISGAYFPWIGSLHSLLDSLVDRQEDHAGGLCSLLDYYDSRRETAIRLQELAARSRQVGERLPRARTHRVILSAMCSYYLSAPLYDDAESRVVTGTLTHALGPVLRAAILMFRSRRVLHTLTRRTYT